MTDYAADKTAEFIWQATGISGGTQELRSGDQVVATLQITNLGRDAEVTAAEGQYTIKQQGVFGRRFLLYNAAGSEVAHFEQGWTASHGVVQFSDGGQVGWVNTSMWHNNWAFEDAEGNHVIRFTSKNSWTKSRAEVVVDPAFAGRPDLLLLLALGWFLIIQAQNAATASAIAVSVTTF